ncbi:MAG TPA: cold shock domain-containing protein [Stellaceae bacterium]|nr:cold shock domain-containing protein [Stellaceae bacterium]
MSKGKEFRAPRRRGFDDDMPSSYDRRDASPPPRSSFGGGGMDSGASSGPVVDATVKWFNSEKGFGFAELADGTGDAFMHINALQSAGYETVSPGTKLRVQVGSGMKGPQITKVLEVDTSTATESAPRSSSPRPGGSSRPPRVSVDPSTAVELTGTVKWFNEEKGFGFVACDDGRKDVFVHISVVGAAGLDSIAEGQALSMRVVETPKGREALSIALAR